jgi:predicted nucleic acid-binding protein
MNRSETSALVIDASVAIAICVEEPLADVADRIIRARRARGDNLLVPTFFWLEVINVLALRYRLTPNRVLEAIAALDGMSLETVDLGRPQVLLTLDVIARTGLTAYDAAYVALAESADADLLTFDRQLGAAAGKRSLPVRAHEIKETAQPYGPSWAEWPGAAAYLKKLRAQVLREANG